ncbi:NUDIX domain-containing protein [Actinacidiphila acidipaludis]|uniref:NUDIX domain-containing protein n=1 Tax=Actinacidiphila acidipaludis TaxID=2873382 RepID=A0ABS7Q3I0_9ACTN|nr:NUDIX domain-containing protein [Streptomyces acidipaludis]MBY8877692.1 NUDIX domain-containing protein [Streptomyces acidipaludis]
MTVLVAAVIVHDTARDRIVLLRRGAGSPFGHGLWDLPAGKCEPAEPVTHAAVRELREETGLVVDPQALTLAHVLHAGTGVGAPNGYLTVAFAARAWSGEPENREPGKHDHVGWVRLDALPRELVPSADKVLRGWRAGLPGPTLHRWD